MFTEQFRSMYYQGLYALLPMLVACAHAALHHLTNKHKHAQNTRCTQDWQFLCVCVCVCVFPGYSVPNSAVWQNGIATFVISLSVIVISHYYNAAL